MRSGRRMILVGLAVGLLVAPAAQAANRRVTVGTPPPDQKKFQALGADVNDFFPHRTKIRVGDKVKFVPAGFHNVDIPAEGGSGAPLLAPTGNQASSTDANGDPFWFNGQPLFGFNPALFASSWGKKLSYDGSEAINSGLPLEDEPGAMTVKFRKAGKVTLLCDVHPGMTGVVKVRPKKASSPSARRHRKKVRAQVKRDLASAEALASAPIADGQVSLGAADENGVEVLAFVPGARTVPVGSTVTFFMDPDSYETHTSTTGPGDIQDASSYIGALAAAFEAPEIDGRATYPSSPPGETIPVSPTAHGNGFASTGALDAVGASPLPPAATMRFDAPGTYTFYCLIHPFMKGTVTAEG